MLRICLYGASANLGGTETYMISLIKSLKGIICFDFLVGHNVKTIPREKEINELGGKIYREYFAVKEKKDPQYISAKEIIKKHPEWDGIYLNLQQINTAYNLLIAAKKVGMKYRIIHSHCSTWMKKTTIRDYIYKFFFSITKSFVVTHRLACSQSAGEWMFGNRSSFEIVPNSIIFEQFLFNEEERIIKREQFQIKSNEIVIGFLGRITEVKNPLFMVDIFKEFPKNGYRLLMVGDGNMFEELEKYIISNKLKDKVILTGEVSNSRDYYQIMDCFVAPSLFEGFGIVLLEAQAAGLPCYTTKWRVPNETNVTGNVTFIDRLDNPQKWAEVIIKNGFKRYSEIEMLNNSIYSIQYLKNKMLEIFQIDK